MLEVQEADGGDGFALVGPVAHLGPGDRAEVSGERQTHRRYGRQLAAQGALPLDPADREGQVAYLSTLRHIGKKRAERLVDQHGEEVMQVIAADPQRTFQALKGVQRRPGRGGDPVLAREPAPSRELHVQLRPTASPTWRRRSTPAMPERLAGDPARGPLPADRGRGGRLRPRRQDRARLADMPPESDNGPQAAAVYVLREAENGGNSFLPMEELAARTAKLIGLVPDPAVLESARGLVNDRRPRLPRADPGKRARGGGDAGAPAGARPASSTTSRRRTTRTSEMHRRAVGWPCAAPSARASRC